MSHSETSFLAVVEPDITAVPACSSSCRTPFAAIQHEEDCPYLLGWSLLPPLPFHSLSLSSPPLMTCKEGHRPIPQQDRESSSWKNSTHSQRWQSGVISRAKDRPATGSKPLHWTLIRRGSCCCCTSLRMSSPVAQSWALSQKWRPDERDEKSPHDKTALSKTRILAKEGPLVWALETDAGQHQTT